jgi:hypothetical protein
MCVIVLAMCMIVMMVAIAVCVEIMIVIAMLVIVIIVVVVRAIMSDRGGAVSQLLGRVVRVNMIVVRVITWR